MIRKSAHTLEEWLNARETGVACNGTRIRRCIEVAEGVPFEICSEGIQHFGSGGGCAFAVFAGEPPEEVPGTERRESGPFMTDYYTTVSLRAGSAVYYESSDLIGRRPRIFDATLYVCE